MMRLTGPGVKKPDEPKKMLMNMEVFYRSRPPRISVRIPSTRHRHHETIEAILMPGRFIKPEGQSYYPTVVRDPKEYGKGSTSRHR